MRGKGTGAATQASPLLRAWGRKREHHVTPNAADFASSIMRYCSGATWRCGACGQGAKAEIRAACKTTQTETIISDQALVELIPTPAVAA